MYLKRILLPNLFLFFQVFCSAQVTCDFKYQNKKGGHYLFSTFFEDDLITLKEGICMNTAQGIVYEKRVFSKGRLVEEVLNSPDTHKPRAYFKLNTHSNDTIIGIQKIWNELGSLTQESVFYINTSGRRCESKKEYWPNGNLRFKQHYGYMKPEELDPSELRYHSQSTIDEEGYTYTRVAFGEFFEYYLEGSIKEITTFQSNFQNNYGLELKEGIYQSYWEDHHLKVKGYYSRNTKNGKWTEYFHNGLVREEQMYTMNQPVNTWNGYFEDGRNRFIWTYDTSATHLFEPSKLEWNQSGVKIKKVTFDTAGTKMERIWNDSGILTDEKIFVQYGNMLTSETHWFTNGTLKSLLNNRLGADTTYIAYFDNKKLSKLHRYQEQLSSTGKTIYKTNKEWNDLGILMLEVRTSSSDDLETFSMSTYFNSGIQKQFIFQKNKERIEEYYLPNGIKWKSIQRIDGLLSGPCDMLDSLGNLVQTIHYKNGLRHGISRTYDKDKKPTFGTNYINGCMDTAAFVFIQSKNKPFKNISQTEKAKYYAFTYELLNQSNSLDPNQMEYSKQTIDSLAEALFHLNQFWDSRVPFPLTSTQSKKTQIEFILPLNMYKGVDVCDTMNPYVKQFYSLIHSLGWAYPKKMELKKDAYVFSLVDEKFYTAGYFNTHFSWYMQHGFARLTGLPTQNSIDDGLKYRYSNRSRLSITRKNDCCFLATFIQGGKSIQMILYSDGEVEMYNDQYSWEEFLNQPEELMQWD